MEPIYLDHNATTPLDPEVLEAMRPHWLAGGQPREPPRRRPGGPAGAGAVARESVARILGASPDEVVFTSGGTEANNLAIFGLAGRTGSRAGHVVSSPIEHPAVAEPVARLEAAGFAVDRPGVDAEGLADAEAMAEALRPETRLATLMLANNETGAIQPVARAGGAGRGAGGPGPYRRGAGGRADPGRFPRAGRRHAGGQRPQVPRPGGGRAAAGPRGGRAGARDCSAGASSGGGGPARRRWPWPSAWPRPWNAGRPRPRPGSPAGRACATGWKPGLVAALGPGAGRPQRPGRRRRAAPADAQRRLPRPRRRRPPDAARPRRRRRLARLGLRQRGHRALADPAGHGRPRRPPPLLRPLQPRGGTTEAEIDEALARIVAAVKRIR